MAEDKVQMVIRLTEAEREHVKELAGAENKSMNQYVLDKVLSVNDSKEATNDSGNDSASDMTIKVLSQQIAVKDEQINKMQQLLDQQQRITLAEVGEKDKLRIESMEFKEETKKKNLFQRLFRR